MAICNGLTLPTKSIYRGDTDKFTATIYADGVPFNITGFTVKMTVRPQLPPKTVIDDSDASISSTATIPVGTDGKAEFDITPEQTKNLDIRDYYYDLQIKEDTGDTYTVGVGIYRVKNEVTRG